MVKTVIYQHRNSYHTLNELTSTTKNIWLCLHGLGYLAKYFKKYFDGLESQENYIIIPQAPSKFYQDQQFKHVGACWLTRVDTQQEMSNNLSYLTQILDEEHILGDPRLIILGYSQGVSIATRFLVNYNQKIKALILHSGSIPEEHGDQDAAVLKNTPDQIFHISGTKDEYATPERELSEQNKIKRIFGTKCERYRPDIKHVVHVPLIEELAKRLA
ncbi:MAG: alpha/beta fold hydrolase [Nonlabens sp.]